MEIWDLFADTHNQSMVRELSLTAPDHFRDLITDGLTSTYSDEDLILELDEEKAKYIKVLVSSLRTVGCSFPWCCNGC